MLEEIKKNKSNVSYFIGEDKKVINHILKGLLTEATNEGKTIWFRSVEDLDLENQEPDVKYVVIECVDAFLTPKQQRLIMYKLLGKYPNATIICGTNSPFITQSLNGSAIYKIDETFKTKDNIKLSRKTGERKAESGKEIAPQGSIALTEAQWQAIARQFPRCGWLIADI